jgi:hypothetical protein
MPEAPPQTALVTTQGAGLLERFAWPMALGQRVILGEPLGRASLAALLGLAREGQGGALEGLRRLLQVQARQLMAQPVAVEIQEPELRLVAVAYHICWTFHAQAEEGRLWRHRADALFEGCERLLKSVGLPRSLGQLVGRHLLLRNLPELYRTDTRLEFGALWGSLEFLGSSPQWVRWPLRSDPLVTRRQTWLHEHIYARPAGRLYYGVMSRSPLTSLLRCERVHPQFTFWGATAALANRELCRLVTNDYLSRGLVAVMPALANAAWRFFEDQREPLAHRRYIARFLLNLGLSWCHFQAPEALLAPPPSPSGDTLALLKALGAAPTHPVDLSKLASPRRELLEPRAFYLLFGGLYALREALGAAWVAQEPALQEQAARFVSAASLTLDELAATRRRLQRGLGYAEL